MYRRSVLPCNFLASWRFNRLSPACVRRSSQYFDELFQCKEDHLAAKIPLSRVHQSETINRRILEVVKGGNYILGPECKAFEAELAAYFGVKHVVLSSSWTAAVHLLHIAQGIKPGDEILVPSLTAFPSIEPMIHAGATPVFCDIDDTYTIDPEDARKRITRNRRHSARSSLRPPG
jgi:dTDP-4-amino-4,6-dideoxygalactose transaminase